MFLNLLIDFKHTCNFNTRVHELRKYAQLNTRMIINFTFLGIDSMYMMHVINREPQFRRKVCQAPKHKCIKFKLV